MWFLLFLVLLGWLFLVEVKGDVKLEGEGLGLGLGAGVGVGMRMGGDWGGRVGLGVVFLRIGLYWRFGFLRKFGFWLFDVELLVIWIDDFFFWGCCFYICVVGRGGVV